MVATTTQQTSSLQTTALTREVNKFLHKHSIFANQMISSALPDGFKQGDPRPKCFDLSSYFGKDLQKGQTVRVPDIQERLYAKTKLENSSVEYQALNASNVDLTITTHSYVAVSLEDYQKYYNNVNKFEDINLEAQVAALSQKVEEDHFNLFSNFTTNTTIGTGSGYAVSTDDLVTADRTLFKANVPEDMNRFFIGTAETYSSFVLSRDEYQLYGGEGSRIFETGRFYKKVANFNVFRSNNVVVTGNAAKQLAFTDNAMMSGFGFKPRTQEQYDIDQLAKKKVVDMIFGIAIKRQAFGVLVDGDDTNNI